MHKLALVAIGWVFALTSWAQAPAPPTGLQAIPALTSRVIDQTQTLSETEMSGLQTQLKTVEDTQGAQIVVLMIATTQLEDIFSYSNRVANTWKIGRKDVGDGVLIVVAKNDRKLRIEIAKSLEGIIPDLATSDIIANSITPAFKQSQYGQGLQAGIAKISARIAGDASSATVSKTDPASMQLGDTSPNLLGLIGIVILFLLALRFLGFGNTMLILMSMSRGGGASYNSGGGGGGFSSGGGGNFGGGGASGNW
jgi:uncharacterized protein